MRVIVAHPGKQHSFQTAIALEKSDKLYKYLTTIYDHPGSFTNFLNKFVLKGDYRKKGTGRRCEDIPDKKVKQFCEVLSLLNLFVSKLKLPGSVKGNINDFMADQFGRKVAHYAIKHNVEAVIMYDCTSNTCFQTLEKKAPHIKRILDVSISHRAFLKRTYESDIERYPDSGLRQEQNFLWNEKKMSRYLDEVKHAQYFLVASNIVYESLRFVGVDENQIIRIPYGVDCDKFEYQQKNIVTKPLQLVFVGQVNHRKGIHHLLNVMKNFTPDEVQLKLAGGYDQNGDLYQKYRHLSNVEFCGFITRDKLAKLYQQSDVFVLPTLGEGFAMVILEALSCGLPVLTTQYSGGNDAIVSGYNGIEYNAPDEKKLEDAIRWFVNNPEKLPEMSKVARETAERYTWKHYYAEVDKALEKITDSSKGA